MTASFLSAGRLENDSLYKEWAGNERRRRDRSFAPGHMPGYISPLQTSRQFFTRNERIGLVAESVERDLKIGEIRDIGFQRFLDNERPRPFRFLGYGRL